MRRPSPAIERLLAGLALGGAFLVMASIFAPDFTQAQTSDVIGSASASDDVSAALRSLGTIEDDLYEVRVFAGPEGPLYSVYDRADGSELGVLMTAKQTGERFPDLPIETMQFGDGSALMLAEPQYPDF